MKALIKLTLQCLALYLISYSVLAQVNTVIVYGNGVWSDREMASESLANLKAQLINRFSTEENSQVEYELAYNTTEGKIQDLWESSQQLAQLSLASFYRILGGLSPFPDSLQEEYIRQSIILSESTFTTEDVQKHIDFYKKAINDDLKRIILVPHSQGNYLASISYNNLTIEEQKMFGIVSVANVGGKPADGRLIYTTSTADLVTAALFSLNKALPANVINPSYVVDDFLDYIWETGPIDDPTGHYFLNSYLRIGHASQEAIITNIWSTFYDLPFNKPIQPWKSIGPEGGESITSIAINDLNTDVLFVANGSSGLFKSINGGESWGAIFSDILPENIYSIKIDPLNPSNMFVASSSGLYKSTDEGNTWYKINDTFIQDIAIDPNNNSNIYITGRDFLFSTDGGSNWTSSTEGLPTYMWNYSISIDPNNPLHMYLGGVFSPYLFRSLNAGASWDIANNGLDDVRRITKVLVDSSESSKLYALGSTYNQNKVYKSDNFGFSWEPLNIQDSVTNEFILDPSSLTINRNIPSNIFVGSRDSIFKSLDGGFSWTKNDTSTLYAMIQEIAIDPNNSDIVYAGYGTRYAVPLTGGVIKSQDGGLSWTDVNKGLTAWPIKSISGSKNNLLAVENLGILRSQDEGKSWTKSNCGYSSLPSKVIVDPSNPNIVYSLTSHSNIGKNLYKSIDSGNCWSVSDNGLAAKINSLIPIYNTNTLFAISDNTLYRSDDAAQSWYIVNNTPPKYVQHLTVDQNNPDILYASSLLGGGEGGLYKSIDGGLSWIKLFTTEEGLNNQTVSAIEIDPNNSSNLFIWLSYSFWDGTKSINVSNLYISNNAGISWSKIGIGLPSLTRYEAPSDIIINPSNSNNIFISFAKYGVYESINHGLDWHMLNEGLSTKIILDMELDDASNILYVATTKGVFKHPL